MLEQARLLFEQRSRETMQQQRQELWQNGQELLQGIIRQKPDSFVAQWAQELLDQNKNETDENISNPK